MIREARISDSEQVVPLMLQAMGDLAAKFANSKDPEMINKLFKHFFKLTANQYSFENTLVYIEDDQVLGSINAYDGAKLETLRKPFLNYLKTHNGLEELSQDQETESGEFYIDTVSVTEHAQGKGIGKQLIHAAINRAKELNHQQAGLLVEVENHSALKLYQKIGFVVKNQKNFMGGKYQHMVLNIK